MRRVVQPPARYGAELRHAAPGDGGAGMAWRAVRRIGANGIVPLKFANPEAAQAHAARLGRRETRIVVVERDGGRRTVSADET